jgi:hypothetical protein
VCGVCGVVCVVWCGVLKQSVQFSAVVNSVTIRDACCVDGGAIRPNTNLLATYINNSEHCRFLGVLLANGARSTTSIPSSI